MDGWMDGWMVLSYLVKGQSFLLVLGKSCFASILHYKRQLLMLISKEKLNSFGVPVCHSLASFPILIIINENTTVTVFCSDKLCEYNIFQ